MFRPGGVPQGPPGLSMAPTVASRTGALEDAKVAMEGLKSLQFATLEYAGRRGRAEVFTVWRDMIKIQIQGLDALGVAYWTAISERE